MTYPKHTHATNMSNDTTHDTFLAEAPDTSILAAIWPSGTILLALMAVVLVAKAWA